MFKPFAFAVVMTSSLFAATGAGAGDLRSEPRDGLSSGVSSVGAAPVAAAEPSRQERRSLSPLLQLYDRPGASVDVTLRGRRPRGAAPSAAAPPAATVTVPARQTVPPAPRRLRAPKPGTVIARDSRTAPQGYAYAPTIYSVARAYDIDPAFMGALIRRESGLNPAAVSHAGARGFMQVMPGTAARFGVRGRQLDNPVANLAVGAAYLKSLQRRYGNNLPLILAAYNAGEGAVDRHGRRIPPYRETQGYVVGVLGDYGRAVSRRSVAR